jgi:guanylate kinase
MSSPAPGLLLVLSAPSGAGKTTLARRFVAAHAGDAFFSVSATTRGPRGSERDGVDYHFVSPEKFAALVAEGAFAEWAEVHGRRYGTLRTTVQDALQAGRVAVFDIDVQGGAQIKAHWPRQAISLFVLPPSMQELERRLRARSTDAEDVIVRRMAVARSEIQQGVAQYDYILVNDDIEVAQAHLEAVVRHERARLIGRESADRATAESLVRGRLDVSPWLRG